jgi:hypothetical protein
VESLPAKFPRHYGDKEFQTADGHEMASIVYRMSLSLQSIQGSFIGASSPHGLVAVLAHLTKYSGQNNTTAVHKISFHPELCALSLSMTLSISGVLVHRL